ncbi:MAG TPA: LLM class flavin-dependent oxidoreductase [Thermodesulfobacteriota bacterium]|nr:LLM class flavin-dependent oxidoreductase [Thermodesulfobacteriota bacterium]
MKFGIGYYSLQSPPHAPKEHRQLYSEMLEEISIAEELGFDSAWLTEHHFLADGYCPSLMVTAAAIAARTKKIRIGTGVLLLPLYNPVKVAEDAAVVDIISNGRLILGLGLGYRQEEFDAFEISLKHRKGRMEEGIEILRKSWADGGFSHTGKHFKINNVNVTPKPVQNPIPIWIGAYQEPAIRRVARLGVPLYLASVGTIPFLRRELDMFHKALREFGHDPQKIEQPLVRDVYISTKGEEKAWEEVKEHVAYIYKGYAEWGSMVDANGNALTDPNDPKLEEAVKEQGIFGTPEECVDKIRAFQKALPTFNHLICRFEFPGISHEQVMTSMKLFTEQVMPYIK